MSVQLRVPGVTCAPCPGDVCRCSREPERVCRCVRLQFTVHMRAGSPELSAGRRRRRSGFSSPQVPLLLLRDMSLCYRLLRRLVPGLPPGRSSSRVEVLQRVIDYILELQTELDASCAAGDRGESRSIVTGLSSTNGGHRASRAPGPTSTPASRASPEQTEVQTQ